MKQGKLGGALMCFVLLCALFCGRAMAQDAPGQGILPIEDIGAIEQVAMAEFIAGRRYTGFILKAGDGGPSVNWQELGSLELIGSEDGYTIAFEGEPPSSIDKPGFSRNEHLLSVTGLGDVQSIDQDAFKDCEMLGSLDLNEVAVVGSSAFANCYELERVSLSQGAIVHDGAFAGCTSLSDLNDAGVKLISGEIGAFSGCVSLTSIRIAEGSELPDNAFTGCSALRSVSLGDKLALSARLFSGSRGISELVMGDGATIEEGALKDRAALKTVTLGQDAAIGASAFSGCTNLTRATLGAGSTLGTRAFAGCTRLQVLSGELLGVGEAAFFDCELLTVVALREGGSPVGASAFSGCALLEEVTGKVRHAATRAFENCRALKTIALVDGAKVDSYAFQDCAGLETVTGRLGAVGRGGFSGCSRLRTVSWPTVNTYGIDAFLGCALDFTKTVPTGLSLSNATRQVPYMLFALTAKTVKVAQDDDFDVASVYSLTTASGTPYAALRTPPYYWLDTAFMGDSDHSPKVTLSGTFDTSKVGSYPLKISIPAARYASEHELSFTLQVVEAEDDEPEPETLAAREHSWFIPAEFTATLGFSYALVNGDTSELTLTSGKKAVCKVGDDGVLKPAATGTATITAKTASGEVRKCKVKVVQNRYAKAKPHKGEAGELSTSTKRLYYQNGKLYMELFVVNRTGKGVKNVQGAKLQLWDERTGQLLYERNLGTLLKTKLPNKGSRVFTANVVQAMVNGGKKLDLGHGDVQARLVFGGGV